ncbi:ankyrin repeat domain-containing protein [Kutzneria sp. NPDC051319]|uniref:ankyrin repeat domain-containing protein n=1 Tax=Kutzneria sp. NPDC051319 TaxID=3155047 RepID=UPI0034157961
MAGDLAQVAGYFGTNGEAVRPRPIERVSHRDPVFDPDRTLEYALIYAASHGRADIVEFLLAKQPDLSVREPVHGATALGAARYHHPSAGRPAGSPAVVRLLEAHAR